VQEVCGTWLSGHAAMHHIELVEAPHICLPACGCSGAGSNLIDLPSPVRASHSALLISAPFCGLIFDTREQADLNLIQTLGTPPHFGPTLKRDQIELGECFPNYFQLVPRIVPFFEGVRDVPLTSC